MADLRLRDDRAQLVLVAAISLAVIFVGLALVLNSVIYTQNIASRSNTFTGSAGPSTYRDEVSRNVGTVIVDANHVGSNYTDRTNRIEASVPAVQTALRQYYASSGIVVDVSLDGPMEDALTSGTQIKQNVTTDTGSPSNFTAPSDHAANWTVADGIRIRNFTVTVDESSLRSAGDSNPFTVSIADANGNVHAIRLYAVDGNTTVAVTGPGESTETCVARTSRTTIAITDARVDGTPCDALDFFQRTTAPYKIEFENASSGGSPTATGGYRLTVDKDLTTRYDAATNVSARKVVYGVQLRIGYHDPDTAYETVIRVAPGEPND